MNYRTPHVVADELRAHNRDYVEILDVLYDEKANGRDGSVRCIKAFNRLVETTGAINRLQKEFEELVAKEAHG